MRGDILCAARTASAGRGGDAGPGRGSVRAQAEPLLDGGPAISVGMQPSLRRTLSQTNVSGHNVVQECGTVGHAAP